MNYKFFEMTSHLFNEARFHYEKKRISNQIGSFIATLSKARDDSQIQKIKKDYDTWIKGVKDEIRVQESIGVILDRFEQILEFAHAIATKPDKIIDLYEQQIKFNQRDAYILNFHLGCLQLFSYIDSQRLEFLQEAQKSFNVASHQIWSDKEDLNFWQALMYHLKNDKDNCNYFLKTFFHESKNVSELILEDGYIPWLKRKIPQDFMVHAKKSYQDYIKR